MPNFGILQAATVFYYLDKNDTGGSADTFAGESNKPIDRVQIIVKE